MSLFDYPSTIDYKNISLIFDDKLLLQETSFESVSWRINNRVKTVSGLLVLCLNIGVDPPDIKKFSPYATLECWIEPASLCPHEALRMIGNLLQDQYLKCQPKAKYKQCLDPTIDDIQKLCTSLRKNAKEERVLFHYNGHGVPMPTNNGELWFFNKNYTQYMPFSITELKNSLGSPTLFVFDCSNSSTIINQYLKINDSEKAGSDAGIPLKMPESSDQLNITYDSDIFLGASRQNESLNFSSNLPADLFTACLTTPLKMAIKWHLLCNSLGLFEKSDLELYDKIPGNLGDRHTLLGELNWIFTAITDSIAWNSIPKSLFQMLYRQDLLVAFLFRNFLLAQRIFHKFGNFPVSHPKLPLTFDNELWNAWDYVLDQTLVRLKNYLREEQAVREEINTHSTKRVQEAQKLIEQRFTEIHEIKDLFEKRESISNHLKDKRSKRLERLQKSKLRSKLSKSRDNDSQLADLNETKRGNEKTPEPPPLSILPPKTENGIRSGRSSRNDQDNSNNNNPQSTTDEIQQPQAAHVVDDVEEQIHPKKKALCNDDHLYVGVLPSNSISPLAQHSPPAPAVVNAILSTHPKLRAMLTEISGFCQSFFSQQLACFRSRLIAHEEIRSDGKIQYHYYTYNNSSNLVSPLSMMLPQPSFSGGSRPDTNITSTSVSRLHELETIRAPSELLPIVLQVLLSLNHRVKALDLLGKFFDMGPSSINQALCVGIFPYTLRLLQSPWKEMKPLLINVWAKILSVDDNCQADLIKENGHKYFIAILNDDTAPIEYRTMAIFCLTSLTYRYPQGQEACMQENLISICLEQLDDTQTDLSRSLLNIMPDAKIRKEFVCKQRFFRFWLVICLSCIWRKYEPARWRAIRDSAPEKLKPLLRQTSLPSSSDISDNTIPSIPLMALFNDKSNATNKNVINVSQQPRTLLEPRNLISNLTTSQKNSSSIPPAPGTGFLKHTLSTRIEYQYYTDTPEIRAATILALGNLISGSSVHSDHSVAVDHSIARDLMSETSASVSLIGSSNSSSNAMVVRDGSYLVRKELVVGIQNLISSYENHFINLVAKLDDESKHSATMALMMSNKKSIATNDMTTTSNRTKKSNAQDSQYFTEISKFGMSKIFSNSSANLSSLTSTPLQGGIPPGSKKSSLISSINIFGSMAGTSTSSNLHSTAVSNINNIYYMIWKTLLTLSQDPQPEVSHSAKTVVNSVKRKVLQISQKRESLANTITNSGSNKLSEKSSSTSSDDKSSLPAFKLKSRQPQTLNIFSSNAANGLTNDVTINSTSKDPSTTTADDEPNHKTLTGGKHGLNNFPQAKINDVQNNGNVIMPPLLSLGTGKALSPDYSYTFSRSRKIFDKGPSLITQDTFSEETLNDDAELGFLNLPSSSSLAQSTTLTDIQGLVNKARGSGSSLLTGHALLNKLYPTSYHRVFSSCVMDARKRFWHQIDSLNPAKENFSREFDRAARDLKFTSNNETLTEARKFFNTRRSVAPTSNTTTAYNSNTSAANNWMPRFDYEMALPKFQDKPVCIKFFPYYPLIAVADIKNNISVWNTDNHQMICNFNNCYNDTRITNLEILNDFDIYPILCVGSSDGSVRIWKNLFKSRQYLPSISYFSPISLDSFMANTGPANKSKSYKMNTPPSASDRASIDSHGPTSGFIDSTNASTGTGAIQSNDTYPNNQFVVNQVLLTSFFSLSDFNASGLKNANLKICWDQLLNYLYVSGDTKIVRIWDLQSQSRFYDICHKSDYSLTSIATSPHTNYMLATGFSDGTIKLFDIRSPASNPIKTYKENNSPVLKIGFYRGTTSDSMISICYNGEIKLWNLNSLSLASMKTSKFSNNVAAADIHPLSAFAAGGLINQTVGIYNPRSYTMNSIKSPSWFISQKTSPVTAIAFHPYKFTLASCSDNTLSFYGLNSAN